MKSLFSNRTLIAETPQKVGQKVRLFGWVNSIRDHGKLVFVDLRDRSGIVQVVGAKEILGELKNEFVVCLEGEVKKRPEKLVNPKISTGGVEVGAKSLEILSSAKELPFDIYGTGRKINEDLRLKYRYLDLRRPRLANNLFLRHQLLQTFRQTLVRHGFWEIETPNLSKSTPEGARDFLVPSRLQPGKFYALPQSPQQYKQLLMVAGFERYFQIATCFRDEDLRADRQLEFKQVDLEMSFVDREAVLTEVEEVMIEVMKALGKPILKTPFPRLTYKEAMEKYHSDKPDLRSEKDEEKLAFAWVVDFPLFEKTPQRTIAPVHHPFTNPNPEDLPLLEKSPLKVRSWQYDLVCNGQEVGGGSIRITDPKIQEKVFAILGHSKEEIREKFGHLLTAFEYGVPPHGGIALGFDRLVAILSGEESIREAIAFPVNTAGKTAVMDAPSAVAEEQLKELGIKIR